MIPKAENRYLRIPLSPTDDDLIGYLSLKILDVPFNDPINRFQDRPDDIYDHNPQLLTDYYAMPIDDYKMYKFQLDRKHPEGNYFTREVGDGNIIEGYWKTHSTKPIIVDNTCTPTIDPFKLFQKRVFNIVRKGVPTSVRLRHVSLNEGPTVGPFSNKSKVTGKHIIGYKMRLIYYEGEGKHGTPTNWVIDEYRVNRNYLPKSSQGEKWVLCKIYQNQKK